MLDSLVFQLTVKRLETQSKLSIMESVETAAKEMIDIYIFELMLAQQEYSSIFVFDSELFSNEEK